MFRQGEVRETTLYYIDMEYCDGNLEEYIAGRSPSSQTPLTMAEVWSVMIDIAKGVEFIHDHGEVHRDLKPQNSLVT